MTNTNLKNKMSQQKTIAVIGLGYVGLPLAVEFGKMREVIGYDIDTRRIRELSKGWDSTRECSCEELNSAKYLSYSDNVDDLRRANIYIITVPTPIDNANRPDLTPLIAASKTVGAVLKVGDIVVYESTVFPGATEEVCVPILEKVSGLTFNKTFFCGYSPERINPGDKEHRLPKIKKITSGSTPQVGEEIYNLYSTIITAGCHKAGSIKVAEAAKVIENTQRDVNIALMNELSLIFHRLGIDTLEVLEAAATKWNFLKFKPGLVGGHCIGVDPYYLTHKALELGYHSEVILAGRRINDSMGRYVAGQTVKIMLKKGFNLQKSRVLVLGLTFKENCPDFRNTKVVDIVNEIKDFNISVDIYDPWVDIAKVKKELDLDCLPHIPADSNYQAIVIAVAHREFIGLGEDGIRALGDSEVVIYDVKGILGKSAIDARL